MITKIHLKNFGPLRDLAWDGLGKINLIIGENGAGKTFILKILYSAMRSMEEFGRGDDKTDLQTMLANKLYWTFQPENLGDLVMKGGDGPLSCRVQMQENFFNYTLGRHAKMPKLDEKITPREVNSLFLPAKEVISLQNNILKSRIHDKIFGFDDTYFDLAVALLVVQQPLNHNSEFYQPRKNLESLIGGNIIYKNDKLQWCFKKGNVTLPMGLTSEGSKKMAILHTLLGNGQLTSDSVLFIDEPEAALHPEAIAKFLDVIAQLAQENIQIFLASHSYFVIKKLYLVAQAKKMSIPVLYSEDKKWLQTDLLEGMPENSIINESVNLYMEEVDLML